jgi:ferritin-like metal-binding protein YciE
MSMSSLEEKFVHDLADLYDAEHRFFEAQQQMLPQASSPQLRSMIEEHLVQTKQQIGNLEAIYVQLGSKPVRVTCDAAAGLVVEGQKGMLEAQPNPSVRDCVIASSQAKVEHYEVAAYRNLIAAAEGMGQRMIVSLLRQNLEQEEQTARRVEQSVPKLLERALVRQERIVL